MVPCQIWSELMKCWSSLIGMYTIKVSQFIKVHNLEEFLADMYLEFALHNNIWMQRKSKHGYGIFILFHF
jgi:hypothetical protein